VGNLVITELERGNLLLEHEIQSAGQRDQRLLLIDVTTHSKDCSLIRGPATSFGDPIPGGGGGKDAHSSKQPTDLALKVRLVGVDHVRVDDVDDQPEKLITHVTPSYNPRSKTGRPDLCGVGVGQGSAGRWTTKSTPDHDDMGHGPRSHSQPELEG
jgi:hypothetical protein